MSCSPCSSRSSIVLMSFVKNPMSVSSKWRTRKRVVRSTFLEVRGSAVSIVCKRGRRPDINEPKLGFRPHVADLESQDAARQYRADAVRSDNDPIAFQQSISDPEQQ